MSTAVSKPWPFWFHELFRTKKYQAYMKAKREAAWKAQEEEFARQERIEQNKREIAKQQRANDLMRQSQRVSLTAKHAASNKPASVPVSRSSVKTNNPSSPQDRQRRQIEEDDGFSTYQDVWAPTHHRTPDPEPTYHGRGGSFDGGGASGDWDRSSSHSSSSHSSSGYDSGSSSSSSSDSGSSSSSSSSD
jgi:hypothetical protein